MKIVDIRTRLASVPFVDPPQTGFLKLEMMELVIVEIETRSGIIGTGHLHPLGGGPQTLEMCIREMLVPLLMGEDARNVEALWQKMWLSTYDQGRMGITVMAMSALDMALWDAIGRHENKPLWQLWGGKPDPLPVYGSGCFRGLGHDGMIEKAQRFVSQGFTAIKMQTAHVFSHDEDVANVRDMREALGDDMEIMVDVNQGWTADEAIAVGKRLEPFNLSWLEEPVRAADTEGYDRIAKAIDIPLSGGENLFTHHDFKPFMESRSVPVLQPDLMRGGYTDLRVTADKADKAGLKIAPHLFPELSIHLAASIPNASWLEYMAWEDHLWAEPLLPVNGMLTPTNRPGHGMDFKPDLVRDHPFRPR